MTNSKQTKKALLSSVIALILCLSMLIGTTFAWFTDTVESGVNEIHAGNLDVELWYKTNINDAWAEVTKDVKLFKEGALYEPGYTEIVYLKVVNAGSLALKYEMAVTVNSETPSTNVYGDVFKLSDYLYAKTEMVDGEAKLAEVNRENTADLFNVYDAPLSKSGMGFEENVMLAGDVQYGYLILQMPTFVGNGANHAKDAPVPTIEMGLTLQATQQIEESDSFGDDYDADAKYDGANIWSGAPNMDWASEAAGTNEDPYLIDSAEDLAGLAALVNGNRSRSAAAQQTYKGKHFKLTTDINLCNIQWTPIGSNGSKFEGTFDGQGHTIYNLVVDGYENCGLFGSVFGGGEIKNVNVENATVVANRKSGVIVGSIYGKVTNCRVTNATVTLVPDLQNDGTYDNGDKAGGIVGYACNAYITDNKVDGLTLKGYRDLGGIIGIANKDDYDTTVTGNEVDNIYIVVDQQTNSYGAKAINAGAVVGRIGNANADSIKNNVSGENVVIHELDECGLLKEGTSYFVFNAEDLQKFAKAVNNGNNFARQTVKLMADIDLNGVKWTPIGDSTNNFQGVFDGQNHTIKNLVVSGYNSNVGLFGFTTAGEIKNLTVENASVSGRLNVGVVAGTPYTTKYTNITVKGHVEVNGMAYVGAVGGKNAYANWDNITVDVDETSYVKAYSVENGIAYRTYVGGVIGFMGEGGHRVSNVTSNIDVLGSTCDVGGVVGIAHYGNTFENITCTGNVTITDATEADETEEIGGIAGVWHNGGEDVNFTNCSFTGGLTANITEGVDLSDNTIVGKPYSASGIGKLYIDGKCVWPEPDKWDGTVDIGWYDDTDTEFTLDSAEQLAGLAQLVDSGESFEGKTVVLDCDVNLYSVDENGEPISFDPIGDDAPFKGTFDGNGHKIEGLYQSGWDFGYEWGSYGSIGLFGNVEGATIKNVTISGFDAQIEGGDIGGIVGSAKGTCVFENITIEDSDFGTYNNGIGGIIGWSGIGGYTFKNITIGEDVVLGGLWGSFDSSIGGVVG